MAYLHEPFFTISLALMLRGTVKMLNFLDCLLPLFSKVQGGGGNVYWCRICDSFDVLDTNQTIRSAIVDFILSSCHFLEALYDPGFRWRTFLGGKPGADIEASHASVATDSPIQPQVWVTKCIFIAFSFSNNS